MHRDRESGVLLIVGALAILLVAASHPSGHDIATAADPRRIVRLNAAVHGGAIGAIALLIAGTLGLHRWLDRTTISAAALTLFALSGAAAMCAAVASGFVAPEILARMRGAADSSSLELLGWYTWRVNQGFARVQVAASAAAILLWSVALVRLSHGAARAAGTFGALAAGAVLGVLLSGRLPLDVHGFGAVMLVESAWLVWVGVLVVRRRDATVVDPSYATGGPRDASGA